MVCEGCNGLGLHRDRMQTLQHLAANESTADFPRPAPFESFAYGFGRLGLGPFFFLCVGGGGLGCTLFGAALTGPFGLLSSAKETETVPTASDRASINVISLLIGCPHLNFQTRACEATASRPRMQRASLYPNSGCNTSSRCRGVRRATVDNQHL